MALRGTAISARRPGESIFRGAIALAATVSIVATAAIFLYLARTGARGAAAVGVGQLFTGTQWKPEAHVYGAVPLVFGTLATAVGAVVIGGAPAILAALWAVELAPSSVKGVYRRAMDVGVAVPSVIYGWLALVHLVPLVGKLAVLLRPNAEAHVGGEGIASASLLLAIMIAPTIIVLSYDALEQVPQAMRDASYALGVSRVQTALHVVLPYVWRRLLLAVFFGFGRAAGETMAVQMVIGGARTMPDSLFAPTTTISAQIVMDMQNAAPGSTESNVLYTMSLVLLLLSVVAVIVTRVLTRRRPGEAQS